MTLLVNKYVVSVILISDLEYFNVDENIEKLYFLAYVILIHRQRFDQPSDESYRSGTAWGKINFFIHIDI